MIGSWDGTRGTNFEFNNRQVTHTNDFSFRFLTPLRNTLLFKTEVSKSMGDDFVQAELVNGVAQVTMNVGGQRRVIIPIFLIFPHLLGCSPMVSVARLSDQFPLESS